MHKRILSSHENGSLVRLTPAAILRVNKTSKTLTFPRRLIDRVTGPVTRPVAQLSQTLEASDGVTCTPLVGMEMNQRDCLFGRKDCNETVNVYFGSDP